MDDIEDAVDEVKQLAFQRVGHAAREKFGMTAEHPMSVKSAWPPYEGTMPAPATRPLRYNYTDACADEEDDYALLVNQVCIHCCSDYCLKKTKDKKLTCRMHFGQVVNQHVRPIQHLL